MSEIEKTLVLLKPDSIQRGLIGQIIDRFEKVGLTIVGMKMIVADKETMDKHYPTDRDSFILNIGNKILENRSKLGTDVKTLFGTEDPRGIGLKVQAWTVEFMQSGPIVAMVLAGPGAIAQVRKMRGPTLPVFAEAGTILGDFSYDSAIVANLQRRGVRNLVHASGNKEEAEFEVNLWFGSNEIHDYRNIQQQYMFDDL